MKISRLIFLMLLVAVSATARVQPVGAPQNSAVSWISPCEDEGSLVDCGNGAVTDCCGSPSACLTFCAQYCGVETCEYVE